MREQDALRIVVIGADAAGMSAANHALRVAKSAGRAVDILALERTEHTSYSACGIPYWIAGDVAEGEDLVARTPEAHRAAGIDLRTGATATSIDADVREVHWSDAHGDHVAPYDELVLATGAEPIVPDWARTSDGDLISGVAPVKDLNDGSAWLDLMQLRPSGRMVVAGGGYIGIEMAEAGLRRGYAVTLLTRSRVMSSLDPELSERVAAGLRAAGVEVHEGVTVDGLEVDQDHNLRAACVGDARHECDLLVVALGVRPRTELADAAGLTLGKDGGLLPDPEGRVAPQIWSAGDCCEVVQRLTGERSFLPLGTHANKAGRAVGANLIVPGSLRFDGALGTAITRFTFGEVDLEISRTGLSTAECEEAGIPVESLVTDGTTASGYMPEAAPLAVQVLAQPGTRRLLGVQIVGGTRAGKRIDAASAALWGQMTVDDLAWMDLSYAPPFATAWEVLQVAARRLAERLS